MDLQTTYFFGVLELMQPHTFAREYHVDFNTILTSSQHHVHNKRGDFPKESQRPGAWAVAAEYLIAVVIRHERECHERHAREDSLQPVLNQASYGISHHSLDHRD